MPKAGKYSDTAIIEAIRQGGVAGRRMTEILFDKHKGLVIRGMSRFRLAEEDSRDVYAEVIVVVCRHIQNGRFEGKSKISTYLYSIFHNLCSNKVRDLKRKRMDMIEEMPDLPDRAKNMLGEMVEQDEISFIEELVDKLGEVCKKIIWGREYYGYSLEEIAEEIGFQNTRSVSTKKSLCLKKLRELLKPYQHFFRMKLTKGEK